MSNNIFNSKRFGLLFKQHFIHNAQFLVFSAVAYVGVIFIVLSVVQASDNLHPHGLESFQGFLVAFVTVFGVLYVGHAFPAFRSKESTISYLMLPASTLEKFLFEFISRICLVLVTLPLLYWITFHLQGYAFDVFTDETFVPFGMHYMFQIDIPEGYEHLIYLLATGGVLLVLSLAFVGSAMFSKQPLVKSLFAVALIVMFFATYIYVIVEHLGVGTYNPPENMLLVPHEEEQILMSVAMLVFASAALMFFVAYRKLKEREV